MPKVQIVEVDRLIAQYWMLRATTSREMIAARKQCAKAKSKMVDTDFRYGSSLKKTAGRIKKSSWSELADMRRKSHGYGN